MFSNEKFKLGTPTHGIFSNKKFKLETFSSKKLELGIITWNI